MSLTAFPQVHVLIDRGSEVLNVHVPEHEVPILKLVHGAQAVQEVGVSDDDIVLDDNADAEFGRLQRKYRRINSPDPVAIAYPMGPTQLSGFKRTGEVVKEAPRADARTAKTRAAEKDAKAGKADKK